MRHVFRKIVTVLIVLGLIGAGVWWFFYRNDKSEMSFRTARLERGDLLVTIDATGTLEPEEVVDVGAQVAGQILSFGKGADGKTIDYRSDIEEGTVLARIDDSTYLAAEAEAEAQVQSAKAGLQQSKADLKQIQAKRLQAKADWERAQRLGPSEALARASYDAYKSAYEVADANVAVGEAAILQAEASVKQAESILQRAKRNLGYCTIKSPVKGVIIDRRVNIGQTVVASLNAPSLFLIAKDLTRMQIWVAVNEADIGKIYVGQPVRFTVTALPDETFQGKVRKIRLNASVTQNVVTYTVEIATDNSDGRLLPYLTADVRFEVQRRDDVLLAPQAALHWTPAPEQVDPEFRREWAKLSAKKVRPGAEPPSSQPSSQAFSQPTSQPASQPGDREAGVLWTVSGQYVRPIPVHVGLSSGGNTEVEGKNLTKGLSVVTGVATKADIEQESASPFTPQFPHRGGGGGRGGPH